MHLSWLQLLFFILLHPESNIYLYIWLDVTDIYLKANDCKAYHEILSNWIATDIKKVTQAPMFKFKTYFAFYLLPLFHLPHLRWVCQVCAGERNNLKIQLWLHRSRHLSTKTSSLFFPESADKGQAMTLLSYKQFLGRSNRQGLSSEIFNKIFKIIVQIYFNRSFTNTW